MQFLCTNSMFQSHVCQTVLNCLPSGISRSKDVAANAPAEAPDIFCKSKCGAYFRKHTATPTKEEEKRQHMMDAFQNIQQFSP